MRNCDDCKWAKDAPDGWECLCRPPMPKAAEIRFYEIFHENRKVCATWEPKAGAQAPAASAEQEGDKTGCDHEVEMTDGGHMLCKKCDSEMELISVAELDALHTELRWRRKTK